MNTGSRERGRLRPRLILPLCALYLTAACSDSAVTSPDPDPGLQLNCGVSADGLRDAGLDRDTIPALTNPELGQLGDPGLLYLSRRARVIGIMLQDDTDTIAIAIPHNILWWHEIVNMNFPNQKLAVTYSPFTGSSLVFERAEAAVEGFEISEYLFNNNLVMRDVDTESLWPQLSRSALCGEREGWSLRTITYVETTWNAWLGLHHDTYAVSRATGFDRLYSLYPYGNYESLHNTTTPFPTSLDPRRPPKERVLGVPVGEGGVAFPFGELADAADQEGGGFVSIAREVVNGTPIVVFWNSVAQGAVAFRPEVDGQELTFEVIDGERRDKETGTVWNFEGRAIEGPLAGKRLEQIGGTYVAFWFAWAEFQPDARLWTFD